MIGDNNYGVFYPENDFLSSDSESESEEESFPKINDFRRNGDERRKVSSKTNLESKLDTIMRNSIDLLPHVAKKSKLNPTKFIKKKSQKQASTVNKFKIKNRSKVLVSS